MFNPQDRFRIVIARPQSVFADGYDSTYRQILSTFSREYDIWIVINEQFMLWDDFNNPVFGELRHYVDTFRMIAEDFDVFLFPM